MHYLDEQRTKTRRDSSLVASSSARLSQCQRPVKEGPPLLPTTIRALNSARGGSSSQLAVVASESNVYPVKRPCGSVREEVITSLFDTMLDNMVNSWTTITKEKSPSLQRITDSDPVVSGRRKKMSTSKATKFRKSNTEEIGPYVPRSRGEFKDNMMTGRGKIQWKDDCWYEGEFEGNIRHGRGTYVDSRNQRSYCGYWYQGTKHGTGKMQYSNDFHNCYEGDWINNIRHGFGVREYCKFSGYRGQWDMNVRHGVGIMVWPNQDFYSGDWKNELMSGYGVYMWNTSINNSLCLPSINGYCGQWSGGKREGDGTLELGHALGSLYEGDFKNNLKHGSGKVVSNNGQIIAHDELFEEDNFRIPDLSKRQNITQPRQSHNNCLTNAYITDDFDDICPFRLCDDTFGLDYHAQQAIETLNEEKLRAVIIQEYLEHNQENNSIGISKKLEEADLEAFINFEKSQLHRIIKKYVCNLKEIYKTYATICNTKKADFEPVLIRLYLWQFLFDCNIHQKGITLVEIDIIFHDNEGWLSKRPHDPFETIYFWQFVQILISLASKLYAKWQLPSTRPKSILAEALNNLLEKDAIPSCGLCKGHLTTELVSCIPLKRLYAVYQCLGEPHSVRDFLCAVRRAPLLTDTSQPALVDADEAHVPRGRNIYIIGDRIVFVAESAPYESHDHCSQEHADDVKADDLNLFNFGNLSSRTIILIFSEIFPNVYKDNKVLNIDIQMTFFEFFQVFVTCAKESVMVAEEEKKLRNKLAEQLGSTLPTIDSPATPTTEHVFN